MDAPREIFVVVTDDGHIWTANATHEQSQADAGAISDADDETARVHRYVLADECPLADTTSEGGE